MDQNSFGTALVEESIAIHRGLGPGLLESVYEAVLFRRLSRRGLAVEARKAIPFEFEGEPFDNGFRADRIVEQRVLFEVKSVEQRHPAHKKQVLT